MTNEEIKDFQRTHLNHLGRALAIDGDLGPQTLWALAVAALVPQRQEIITGLTMYTGEIMESPANRHPVIDRYHEFCRSQLGSPWCAAKVSYVLWHAGVHAFKPTASVLELARQFPAVQWEELIPGDLFYWLNADGLTGHCGGVIGLQREAERLMTSEGNSEDGDNVWIRTLAGLRFFRAVPVPALPGIPPSPKLTLKTRFGGKTR